MKTLVFAATYNEADNLKPLLEGIWKHAPSLDVLVVDDASADGTGRLLDELAEQYPQLAVVHRPRKLGLGTAHKLAFLYALAEGYDALVTMDADFSHHPRYLPEIVEALERGNEFVIGSRYAPGGSCDYTGGRRLISRSANVLTRNLLGLHLHETTTSYRGFRRSLLSRIDVDSIRSSGYSFFLEVAYHVAKLTEKCEEVPIHFEDRRYGATKISRAEVMKGVLTLFGLAGRRSLGKTPQPKSAAADSPGTPSFLCPLCESKFSVLVYPARNQGHDPNQYSCTSRAHSSHGQIVKCLTCDLVVTHPRLPQNEVEDLYSSVEDLLYLENWPSRLATFRHNLRALSPYLPRGARLLDVGAYCGAFLEVAREQSYEVKGIEPSSWATGIARERFGFDVTNGTLRDLPADAKFDVITAWDVMEHLADPVAELERIRGHLRPDGILAFSTLDVGNWFPRLLGERWPWYMDMHLFYFDKAVVREMLLQAGFETLDVRPYRHIITGEYLLEKLESLGVPGMRPLKKSAFGAALRRVMIPFQFGDIQMFICRSPGEEPMTVDAEAMA